MMNEENFARLNQQIKDIHKAIGTLMARMLIARPKLIESNDVMDVLNILRGDVLPKSEGGPREDLERLERHIRTLGHEIDQLVNEVKGLREASGGDKEMNALTKQMVEEIRSDPEWRAQMRRIIDRFVKNNPVHDEPR
jgi:archaellum component FlaC